MVLARFEIPVTDDAGNLLGGGTVTVRAETSGFPLAELYSDRDGLVPIANPLPIASSGSDEGIIGFHVVGGAYRLDVVSGSYSRTRRYVGIGTGAEQDDDPASHLLDYTLTGYTAVSVNAGGLDGLIVTKRNADDVYGFGHPLGYETDFPAFRVDTRFDQFKIVGRSLLLGDPGDTAEVGFYIVDGTPASPSSRTAPYPGAFIYGWPIDNTGSAVPADPGEGLGYPYYGRNAQLGFPIIENPTQTARGGAFLVSVTMPGEVAITDRGWWNGIGLVLPGRGSREDGGVTYPWDADALAIERKSAPGAHNYYNTPAIGNLTLIMSDAANAPGIALRKYNSTTNGVDISFDYSNNAMQFQRVDGGVKSTAAQLRYDNGAWTFGQNAGRASFRIDQQLDGTSAASWLRVAGNTTPSLNADGGSTNIDLRLLAKGATGQVRLANGNGEGLRVNATSTAVNYLKAWGTATGAGVLFEADGTDTNINLRVAAKGTTGEVRLESGGGIGLAVLAETSTVNRLQITGKATAASPILAAVGTDTNIGIAITGKGTGTITLGNGQGSGLLVTATGTAVNNVTITGEPTTTAPIIAATGSDTNINLALAAKGSGGVSINAGDPVKFLKTNTKAIDFGSIAAHGVDSTTVTVTGATTAMFVDVTTINDTLANTSLSFDARVTAADTVTVYCRNNSTGAIDPSSQTVRVVVIGF